MAPLQSIDALIIGAGLAGLSTALHFNGEAAILEARGDVGGKARTEVIDGFRFDLTGHWLHLRDPDIKALVERLMGADAFARIDRISRIWSHGVYTRYPFQANTFGLPPAVVKECLLGAFEAARGRPAHVEPADEPESFADWIRFYFGDGIARHFMIPYNAKLWGVPAETITSRWCQRFVPKPRIDEIVAGAVGCNAGEMGYNAHFLYPRGGGIQPLADALADALGRARIHLETAVVEVRLADRIARLADGREVRYQRLVSTAPLKTFVGLVADAPADVRAAAARLRATDTRYLNVAVEGPLGVPDHWIYVPEERWPMYRVGSFSNALPAMAPPGHASLYVELSDRDSPLEALRPRVEAGLVEMGLIDDPSRVLFMEPRRIRHGYVIYDFDYDDSRGRVLDWLAAAGVQSIGRYGEWKYASMEDALIDGRRAAERLEDPDGERSQAT